MICRGTGGLVYGLARDKPAHLVKSELVCSRLRDGGVATVYGIKPPTEKPQGMGRQDRNGARGRQRLIHNLA
jgi:hypothetical protein